MTRQVVGSLLVAVAIVAVAIAVVTARLGPTSIAELEAAEERQELRIEQREEARKARDDAADPGGGDRDPSGSGRGRGRGGDDDG